MQRILLIEIYLAMLYGNFGVLAKSVGITLCTNLDLLVAGNTLLI